MQNILTSAGPITVVIPDQTATPHWISLAVRIAHILDVYHKLDVEILTDAEALTRLTKDMLSEGNLVIIGMSRNLFARELLSWGRTEFGIDGETSTFRGIRLKERSCGILFTHPHPVQLKSMALFLSGTDEEGLERALRLFPFRTGVAVPDWVIVGKEADVVGAAGVIGAGVWNNEWKWNEPMSWLQ